MAHVVPPTPDFPRYEDWKGRLMSNGFEKWGEELWHVTRWSCGWMDFETCAEHLARLPFLSYDQKLEIVVAHLQRTGASYEGGEPLRLPRRPGRRPVWHV